MRQKQQQQKRTAPPSFSGSLSLDQALAGIGGAVASTTVLHPLDLIKIRLQVDATSQGGNAIIGRAVRAAQQVLRNDGAAGFYRGLVPNLAGNCASWGLYFAWYTWIKEQMAGERSHQSTSGTSTLSPIQHLAAGAAAGALTQCMANPLWVVKTRMCTTSRGDPAAYRGLVHGLTQIASKEGVRGLYKGLAPGLLGVPHGGLQFMAYEEMKKWRLGRHRNSGAKQIADKFTPAEYAAMSTTSKIFALAVTYPSQVLRSRLQRQQHQLQQEQPAASMGSGSVQYKGLGDAVVKITKSEGLAGFYKGFGPGLVRVLPGNIITFLVYENIASYLRTHAG
ncbi:mitochondrial FAD carrier protein flx1 [Dipsacomyces acuminosporus]|nr:mitochondrial FAD carrier protein flx1 [Dipsacomyces acuminosporus]